MKQPTMLRVVVSITACLVLVSPYVFAAGDQELSKTAPIVRIMQSGADVVILVVYPKPAAVLIRDSLKLGYKPVYVGQTAIQDLPQLQEQVGIPGALEKFVSSA